MEGYFIDLEEDYFESIKYYEKKIEKITKDNYNEKDWNYNPTAKEWFNLKLSLNIPIS